MWRPANFQIDRTHPLASGLVFAGLGSSPGAVTMFDSSVYRNNGTLTNMTPASDWIPISELGRWGLDFDGSDDQVTCTGVGAANLSQYPKTTMGAWIWLDSTSTGNDMFFGSGYTSGWMLDVYDKQCELWITNRNVKFGSALSHSTFHHFCVVWDDASYTADGYINGTYVSSQQLSINVSIGSRTTLYLGRNGQSSNLPFIGKLADAVAFNRALTPTEIADLADPSNVYLSGLIAGRPRTRYFLPSSPAAFNPAWARNTNNLISGGVG